MIVIVVTADDLDRRHPPLPNRPHQQLWRKVSDGGHISLAESVKLPRYFALAAWMLKHPRVEKRNVRVGGDIGILGRQQACDGLGGAGAGIGDVLHSLQREGGEKGGGGGGGSC